MIKRRNQACHRPHRRQQGFTLVEIMVAVAISLFLLAGILQVLSSNKHTARFQEAVARIQENARFALMFLGRDFRQAGYTGCSGNAFENHLVLSASVTSNDDNHFNPLNPVAGWEYTATAPADTFPTTNTVGAAASWLPTAPSTSAPDAAVSALAYTGSDIVIVKYVQENTSGATATAPFITVTDPTITLDKKSDVKPDTIVMVSDCVKADLFRSTGLKTDLSLARATGGVLPDNKTIASSNWSHVYNSNMKIMELVSNIYFVAEGAYGGPSLFRADVNSGVPMSTPKELVEGIENMQVLYGEDTTGDTFADRYVTINAVTDVANIVSVRISLLMRSVEQVQTIPVTTSKKINGVDVTSMSDRNIRFVVTSTFKLRNRGVM